MEPLDPRTRDADRDRSDGSGGEADGGQWSTRCAVAGEFWSSGAFGYWPQTVHPTPANSGLDYYFHFAMQGPGSDTAGQMKIAVKPVMDAILLGQRAEAQRGAAERIRDAVRRNSGYRRQALTAGYPPTRGRLSSTRGA